MKKFLFLACIAAASIIAAPAIAQTTNGNKAQTECCKKECKCTDCKGKDCKADCKAWNAPTARAKTARRIARQTVRPTARLINLAANNKPIAINRPTVTSRLPARATATKRLLARATVLRAVPKLLWKSKSSYRKEWNRGCLPSRGQPFLFPFS